MADSEAVAIPHEGGVENNTHEESCSEVETTLQEEAAEEEQQEEQEENHLVKIEDFLQSVIGRAALPQDLSQGGQGSSNTAISKVSNSTLLQMLGCESGAVMTKPPIARAAQAHPSHTRLSILSRLGDEFKSKRTKMTDAFEDILDEKRKAHIERLEGMEREHEEKLEAIRTRYSNIATAKRQLAAEAVREAAGEGAAVMTSKREAAEQEAHAAEIAMLERRILEHGGQKSGSSATVSARRLLTFWKAKYENLCSAFEQQQEQHFTVKAKLEEADTLMGQNSRNLQGIVSVLRNREQEERHRGDSVKAAYLQQCQKQGIPPQEPELSASKVAGSQLSHTKLMMIAQHGYEAVQVAAGAAFGGQEPSSSGSLAAKTQDPGVGESRLTFSKVGAKSPTLVRVVQDRVLDRREECRLIELSISQDDKLIEEVGAQLEAEQGNYSEFVAGIHGPGAVLLEEAVSLSAQADRYHSVFHDQECEKIAVTVRQATKRADLVETIERMWAEGREREEALKRDMREKQIDMVRIRGKINSGQSITLADFSDAPVKDPTLKLDVLKSQLAVLDCERQLLRSRLTEAGVADTDVMRELEERLKIPTVK